MNVKGKVASEKSAEVSSNAKSVLFIVRSFSAIFAIESNFSEDDAQFPAALTTADDSLNLKNLGASD